MATHTLYAYVLPDDAAVDATSIVVKFNEFIAGRSWLCADIRAINQRHETGERELGLNVSLPEPFHEQPGWFADIEAIVARCVQLRHEFGCDFVVGIGDSRSKSIRKA